MNKKIRVFFFLAIALLFPYVQSEGQNQPIPTQPTSQSASRPDPGQASSPDKSINAESQSQPKFKTKQEKARYQQILRRRAQLQRRKRQQMGERTEPSRQQAKLQKNKTQQVMGEEMKKRGEVMQQMGKGQFRGKNSQTVTFQIDLNQAEFIISYTTSMEILIHFRSLVDNNNVLRPASDVNTAGPVRVELYETGTNKFVGFSQFFFLGHIQFSALQNMKYRLRFSNIGLKKLIDLTLPKSLSIIQFGGYFKNELGQKHMEDIQLSYTKISDCLRERRKMNSMQFVNSLHMEKQIKKYSAFQFVEMAIIIVFSLVQLQLVKRLFANDSIL